MWTREELKSKAKIDLKGKWLKSVLVIVIIAILSALVLPVIRSGMNGDEVNPFWFLMMVLLGIFVLSPMQVGIWYYFINNTKNKEEYKDIFMPFSNSYINVIITQLLMGIYTMLWSLLFVIPGIIKSYEYRMIPFIIAENPGISYKEAFKLSKEMTMGNKMKMFVLDLSFIGWAILGILAFGVGAIFVDVYVMATYTRLYLDLKEKVSNTKSVSQ